MFYRFLIWSERIVGLAPLAPLALRTKHIKINCGKRNARTHTHNKNR